MTANVLLVILDSVRAKNTSLHGHHNQTTPFLERFADRSTVYDQARASGIHSMASHVSMFTGYHVAEHGMVSHGSRLDPKTTVWEMLRERGYDTGLFTPNPVVTESSNLPDAFDVAVGPNKRNRIPFPDAHSPDDVENVNDTSVTDYIKQCLTSGKPIRSVANGVSGKLIKEYNDRIVDESAEQYIDRFLEWIDGREGPWGACLNLMDAHYPYLPDSKYDQWGGKTLQKVHKNTYGPYSETFLEGEHWWKLKAFEALYDGSIRQVDASLERLVTQLESLGILDETLLIITSDHSEGFGERSRLEPSVRLIDHSWGIAEELLHVPLIVKFPDEETARRINEPATLTAIPTAIKEALAGSPSPSAFVPDDGVIASTVRLSDPESSLPANCSTPEDYAGSWKAVYNYDDDELIKYATRGSTCKAFRIQDPQLAPIPINQLDQDVDALFDSRIEEHVSVLDAEDDVSANVKQQLRDLGYVT